MTNLIYSGIISMALLGTATAHEPMMEHDERNHMIHHEMQGGRIRGGHNEIYHRNWYEGECFPPWRIERDICRIF